MVYQIIINGKLDQSWSDWLGTVEIGYEPQEDGAVITVISVDVSDQSMLFGILDRIRDLNMPLITVASSETLKSENK